MKKYQTIIEGIILYLGFLTIISLIVYNLINNG